MTIAELDEEFDKAEKSHLKIQNYNKHNIKMTGSVFGNALQQLGGHTGGGYPLVWSVVVEVHPTNQVFLPTVNFPRSENIVDERLAPTCQLLLQGRQRSLVESQPVPVDRPGLGSVVAQEGGVLTDRIHTLNQPRASPRIVQLLGRAFRAVGVKEPNRGANLVVRLGRHVSVVKLAGLLAAHVQLCLCFLA